MFLTPLDERVAFHTVETLRSRWPFVAADEQRDYRGTYRPSDLLDSLAFLVSRGGRWEASKLQLAANYERRGLPDSAASEYRGLVRDAPFFEEPYRLLGRALLAAHRDDAADTVLRRARSLAPTASGSFALAAIALRRSDVASGIDLLRESLRLEPDNPAALYQLSLAYGLAHDLDGARATAVRLHQVAPGYPGLAGWLKTIGLQ
jgi:predicted Zn-dependent protease